MDDLPGTYNRRLNSPERSGQIAIPTRKVHKYGHILRRPTAFREGGRHAPAIQLRQETTENTPRRPRKGNGVAELNEAELGFHGVGTKVRGRLSKEDLRSNHQ